MSFINIIKNRGPRIDPWGTPTLIVRHLESALSLISVLDKVMERCIYKHVYNYLLKNSIITPEQSGFTPGDSAINQLLLSLTNEFGKALDYF
jgi:hypothetical protein